MQTRLHSSPSQKISATHAPVGYWLLKGAFVKPYSLLIPKRALVVNLLLLVAVCGLSILSLGTGEVQLSAQEVVSALLGEGNRLHQLVVNELRLQRLIAGLATGAAFALSGCLMQTLARNRLATPGIIGIDNGATAFAVASVVGTGLSLAPSAMALVGAATASAIAFGLAGDAGRRGYRFIVAGVAVGAIAAAATQFLLSTVDVDDANAAYPWTVGTLNARNPIATQLLCWVLMLSLGMAALLTKALRQLQLCEASCIALGGSPKRIRLQGLILSVVLTGVAVAVAGPVGLVSLLGPELARQLCANKGVAIMSTALCGALLMLLADLFGRLAFAPYEVPVGIVTAVAGSPYLLWMLLNPSFKNKL